MTRFTNALVALAAWEEYPRMPRTVPSQVIALIDNHFPDINSPALDVSHLTAGILLGVARLIGEIPVELFAISGEDYGNLVCGAEAIKSSVAFWQQKGVGQIGQPGIGG